MNCLTWFFMSHTLEFLGHFLIRNECGRSNPLSTGFYFLVICSLGILYFASKTTCKERNPYSSTRIIQSSIDLFKLDNGQMVAMLICVEMNRTCWQQLWVRSAIRTCFVRMAFLNELNLFNSINICTSPSPVFKPSNMFNFLSVLDKG